MARCVSEGQQLCIIHCFNFILKLRSCSMNELLNRNVFTAYFFGQKKTNIMHCALDLLITRDDDQLVTSVSIHDAAFSGHFVVNCALSLEKPSFTRKQIIYRSFKSFDIDLFISDIRGSSLIGDRPNELDDLVALCDSELSGIFNRHVPIKKSTVTIRPAAPWYSEELKFEKREKRRLERRWRASRSMRDREAYTRQC